MPVTILYTPKNPNLNLAGIAGLVLDASPSQQFQADMDVTDHPVEEGANITDHARQRPQMLTIEGVISNTPISHSDQGRVVQSQGISFTSNAPEDAPQGAVGYAENALTILLEIEASKQLLTILTDHRNYYNMMLSGLNVPTDVRTGDALRFTAQFKQIRLAKVRTEDVVVAREKKAHGTKDTGKKIPIEGPPLPEQTAAKRLLDKTGGTRVLDRELGTEGRGYNSEDIDN